MRIKAIILTLIVVGTVLTANLLIDNRTMSSPQLVKVTTGCFQCHSPVPKYDTVLGLHNKMASFNCSRCHSDNSVLKTTDKVHGGLQWLGIGTILFVLTGITTSLLITNRRNKVN
jgi:hypothetical protein